MSTNPGPLMRFDIPGRPNGGVRVYRPAANKTSYRVVWRDDGNRPQERTRTSLEEAERIAEDQATRLASTIAVGSAGPEPTLGDLLHHYLYGPGRPTTWRSEKTARRPEQVARRILLASDLARPAREFLSVDGRPLLQDILDRAAAKGCTPGGWEYAKAGELLRTVLATGHHDGLVEMTGRNPMDALRFRRNHFASSVDSRAMTINYVGPEARPPTQRVLEFIDATEQRFGATEARYVEVLAFAGLRPGEANALSRDQLGVERPGLWIDRQLLELTSREARQFDGETQQVRPPKWGRYRNAYFPRELLDGLHRLAETTAPGPNGALFPTANGALRRQNNWRRDVFRPIALYVGWPTRPVFVRNRQEHHFVWPVYGFRHHYANYLLKDLGLPLVSVARFMGHRDSRTTELMYLKTELDDLDVAEDAYHRNQRRADR